MKKVLYLTNIEVPYRVKFFNELSGHCELTVLYEREKSSNRNADWSKSVKRQYKVKYLRGIHVGGENTFSPGIFKHIFSKYDVIIVGCYNSPVQMLAILTMRLFRIPYLLNLDGNPYISGTDIKTKLKRFFIKGAERYLVAGEKNAALLEDVVSDKIVVPYYFSSLTDKEVSENGADINFYDRDNTILVVGQYFDYKGMDIALQAAKMDDRYRYKFVGMGSRTELFIKEQKADQLSNVEFIPFLSKTDLYKEYKRASLLVLPSRQECWGLVVNEAASFGTPIVSTWGSGAAVEFISDDYPQYLAKPNDAEELLSCIKRFMHSPQKQEYSEFLINKSKEYHIENCVRCHIKAGGL